MITVAVVGILAAVALPSYNDFLRRGQIQEAFGNLADFRVKMEQYYQDFRNYGTGGTTTCANGTGAPSWNSFAASKYFTYSCVLTGAGTLNQAYTLTATGSSGRATGHTYKLTSDNVQSTTVFKGAAVTKGCWLAKGSEC